MTTIVVFGTLSLLGLFVYLGTTALNENTRRTLEERVVLAQTTARHIDYVLAGIESVLTETVAQHRWQTPLSASENLASIFQRLNFYATRVFLVDHTGQSLTAYPPIDSVVAFGQFASVQAVLSGQAFATSRYLRTLDGYGGSTLAAVPIRQDGQVVGALVISIDLLGSQIRIFTSSTGLGETGYIDLIDLRGTILASTRDERIGILSDHEEILGNLIREQRETVSACHDCHTTTTTAVPINEVLAFAPLERAQWGVAVHQSENEVFGPIRQLQMRIFALMIIMLAGVLLLVYLTTRSVISPVQALTIATKRIATGDLDTPLGMHGKDEIGTLAASFDTMREQLKNLMARIQTWNRELDARVHERTIAVEQAKSEIVQLYDELRRKEQVRTELLRRIFSAQEEERKRISRELHDETAQVLTGLAYALDDAAEMTAEPEIKSQMERMHTLASTAMEEIHRIILDLRPTMLDHLGLIPALRWYAESRFSEMDIRFALHETGQGCRLSPAIEIAVFRVVQEAINNIARHSDARHAELGFNFEVDHLQVTLTDDGKGFDANQVFNPTGDRRGLGLVGMRERIDAIGGELILRSAPRMGTLVQLNVPFDEPTPRAEIKDDNNAKGNSGFVGG